MLRKVGAHRAKNFGHMILHHPFMQINMNCHTLQQPHSQGLIPLDIGTDRLDSLEIGHPRYVQLPTVKTR